MELFKEMIPLKKKWCCHPIEDDDKVLDLAAQAGAWFVYQAILIRLISSVTVLNAITITALPWKAAFCWG